MSKNDRQALIKFLQSL